MSLCLRLTLLVFILIGCNYDKKPFNDTDHFLKEAQNESNSLAKRIAFAFKADSVAINNENKVQHLYCLRLIGNIYLENGNMALARNFFNKTIELAMKLSDKETFAIAINNQGLIANELAEYDSAIICFNEAELIFRELGKQDLAGQALIDKGISYEYQGKYEDA